ncbi:MAG TPA: hypothetical protein VGG10_20155 [Rhizomicrobium sp.]|jgi:hypothetical protein
MFFEGGAATASQLVSRVMEDIAGIPGIVSEVLNIGPFTMVAADWDWMITDQAKFEELFERFVIPTPMRPNSYRAEILLVAVCDGVITQGRCGSFALSLSSAELPAEMAEKLVSSARALVWRFTGHAQ